MQEKGELSGKKALHAFFGGVCVPVLLHLFWVLVSIVVCHLDIRVVSLPCDCSFKASTSLSLHTFLRPLKSNGEKSRHRKHTEVMVLHVRGDSVLPTVSLTR